MPPHFALVASIAFTLVLLYVAWESPWVDRWRGR